MRRVARHRDLWCLESNLKGTKISLYENCSSRNDNKWHFRNKSMCASSLWSVMNGAMSLISRHHTAALIIQSKRTGRNEECDFVSWYSLACLCHFQTHRWILASRFDEHQYVALSQSKQDVNVIRSYSSSSKLGIRSYNQVSQNFLKGPVRTRSFTDRLWMATSILIFI